jgi:LuxR family maltose regulon positive regulatory protein
MTDLLLQTKTTVPPSRPDLIPRPNLRKILNSGMEQKAKLFLVSAPAGFGKTSLVREWIHEPDSWTVELPEFAWVSIDEDDNDLRRFFTYISTAIQGVAGTGQSIRGYLEAPQPAPPRSMATAIINDCATTSSTLVLVLDDYHAISSETIDEAVAYLIDNLPSHMHLVITTRTDPLIPLSRLRASGQMVELRTEDLRFRPDETATFLDQTVGIPLTSDEIRALEMRTEGWIAGLQMAALSMKRFKNHEEIEAFVSAFSGSHRYIFDYLADEVMHQRPPGTESFLLQTSILDRLSGPLCDSVSDRKNSQALLEELDAANLFIMPLDSERRWFRYHQLFADQLRHRLSITYPDKISELHQRASKWYEDNDLPVEAIKHALGADDVLRAAHIVETVGRLWLARSELGLLLRWLSSLPAYLISDRPNLGLLQGWALALINQFEAVEPALQNADKAFHAALAEPDSLPGLGLDDPEHRAVFQGYLATCRAALARAQADPYLAIKHLRQALEYFPESEQGGRGVATLYLGYALWMAGDAWKARQTFEQALRISIAGGQLLAAQSALDALGKIMLELGELKEGLKIHLRALELAEEHTKQTGHQSPGIGLAHNGLAILHYEWNDLEVARKHAEKGMMFFEPWGMTENLLDSYSILARIHLARGDATKGFEFAQTATSLVSDPSTPAWLRAMIETRQAKLRLMAAPKQPEVIATVSEWAEAAGLTPDDEASYQREREYIVLSRLLMSRGDIDQALDLLDKLYEQAAGGKRWGRVIEINVLKALALQEGERSRPALEIMEEVLSATEPEGYIRLFVDEGPPMTRLLSQCVTKGTSLRYASDIQAQFPRTGSSPTVSRQSLVDPLSDREIEVLQLLADGLSRPQIAGQLHLSINTVKTHARNIYSKLNVRNRAAAIARARDLHLID